MNHTFLHNPPFLIIAMISLTSLLTVGCERTNDPDHELRRRLEAQAASETASVTVSLGYIHQFHESLENQASKTSETSETSESSDNSDIQNDRILHARGSQGEEIEIEQFYLVTSAMELHICEEGFDPSFGQRLQQWLLPTAHAHVPSSATRLGVPFVENLLAEPGLARIVGSIAPPLYNYCRLYAILSPADDDVLNLTSLEPDQIEHKTLLITGRFRTAPEHPWQPFSLDSTARRAIEMKLIAPDTGQQPLALAPSPGHALILIDKTIGAAIFDDLEINSLLDGSAASTVLDRLSASFHIHEFQQEDR